MKNGHALSESSADRRSRRVATIRIDVGATMACKFGTMVCRVPSIDAFEQCRKHPTNLL
jgi:hypothetical protein